MHIPLFRPSDTSHSVWTQAVWELTWNGSLTSILPYSEADFCEVNNSSLLETRMSAWWLFWDQNSLVSAAGLSECTMQIDPAPGSLFTSFYCMWGWSLELGRTLLTVHQPWRTRLSGYKLSPNPKSDTKLFHCLVEDYNYLGLTNSLILFCSATFLRREERNRETWQYWMSEFTGISGVWLIFTTYARGLWVFLTAL